MAREARGGPSLASRPTSFVLEVMFDVMWCACVFSFHVVVSSRWWCWVYIYISIFGSILYMMCL